MASNNPSVNYSFLGKSGKPKRSLTGSSSEYEPTALTKEVNMIDPNPNNSYKKKKNRFFRRGKPP